MSHFADFCNLTEGFKALNFICSIIPTITTTTVAGWSLYHLWKCNGDMKVSQQIKYSTTVVLILFESIVLCKSVSDLECLNINNSDSMHTLGYQVRKPILTLYGISLTMMLFLFFFRLEQSFQGSIYRMSQCTSRTLIFTLVVMLVNIVCCGILFYTDYVSESIAGALPWSIMYYLAAINILVLFVRKLQKVT